MRYLQPKFSVGGAGSDAYRDNFDRIFRNPEASARPEIAPPAPPVVDEEKLAAIYRAGATCEHGAASPTLVGKFVVRCFDCDLFVTTKEWERIVVHDRDADEAAVALDIARDLLEEKRA